MRGRLRRKATGKVKRKANSKKRKRGKRSLSSRRGKEASVRQNKPAVPPVAKVASTLPMFAHRNILFVKSIRKAFERETQRRGKGKEGMCTSETPKGWREREEGEVEEEKKEKERGEEREGEGERGGERAKVRGEERRR